MPCAKQWFNLVGAGLCGVGSGIGGVVSLGAGQGWVTVAAVFGVLGSISWAISGWMDLAECLEAAGRPAEADAARNHAQALQTEHDRLLQSVS
jgi:uncharacterized membrane protein